jgi:hypothetical protein
MSPPPDGDLVWMHSEQAGTDCGYYDRDQHQWRWWTGDLCKRPEWWARVEFPAAPKER